MWDPHVSTTIEMSKAALQENIASTNQVTRRLQSYGKVVKYTNNSATDKTTLIQILSLRNLIAMITSSRSKYFLTNTDKTFNVYFMHIIS